MAVTIEWDCVWRVLDGCVERQDKESASVVWESATAAISSMSPDDFQTAMVGCSTLYANDLWQAYIARTDLSRYGIKYIAKMTDSLSPAICLLVWAAWLNQVDISDYGAETIKKAAKNLPRPVKELINSAWANTQAIQPSKMLQRLS